MSAFKSAAMMRELKQSLELLVAGVSFIEGSDSSFFPVLMASKGGEALFVKIEMVSDPAGHKDGLDLPQRLYSPHKITIERDSTMAQAAFKEVVTSEAVKLGCKVSIFEKAGIAAETAISGFDLSGATLVVELKTDSLMQNPLTNSQ